MNDSSRLALAQQRLRQLLASNSSALLPELLRAGAELDQEGDREAALAAFEAAVTRGVDHVSWWHAVAALRLALGRPKSALDACNEAFRLAPENPDTLFNKAVVLESLGERLQALLHYQRVLAINGKHLGALLNQVSLFLSERHLDEALHLSEEAIRRHPGNSDCWFNHGEVMTTVNRHADALDAYKRALLLQPNCIKADVAAAVALAALGRLEQAGRRLATLNDSNPQALANFRSPLETDRVSAYPELESGRIALIAAYQRFRLCDWSVRDDFIRLFEYVVEGRACKPMDNPDLPFLSIGLPLSGECRLRAARQVAKRISAEVRGAPLVRPQRSKGTVERQLRIGYLSGDFRRHATAYLMSRLPGLHDRERFEVFVYSTGPDDRSTIRGEIIAGADHFCDVAGFDAATVAQRIAMDGIDILVDLSGYTLYACSAALVLRPAPLQVSYLAYLQTSGAPWIDYVLLDRVALTENERLFWTEKIAYLPHTLYLCDDGQPLRTAFPSRAEAGLPEDVFIYCCLGAAWKIDPETFACWMVILRRVPNSVLWLYGDFPGSQDYLRAAALSAGIEGQRLVFAPQVSHEEHLARFRFADVFLDTFVCNGHTTCIEALDVGVPVVTLPGETVVSRVAASLLIAHGVAETVVSSHDAYVEMACQLAEDASRLAAIRQKLKERSESKLFCTERRVRELEQAYKTMWECHASGQAASDFDVATPFLAG